MKLKLNSADVKGYVSGGLLLLVLASALLAHVIAPFDPYQQSLAQIFMPPLTEAPEGGMFWLGTDQLGRDIMARMMAGGQVSLAVGIVAMLLSILIGHRQGVLGFDVPGLAASAGTVKARLAWLSGWGLGVAKESDWKNARRPDRLGQMLAPSACEPFLSAIRSAAPGSVPWDLTTESEGGGDEGAERAC